MQQYYTLEQAAQILRINPDQLKEMARKKEIRAFQDRSGWRFRAQEIDEMARAKGYGSDPELPLGEAAKAKPGDSGGNEVFNFNLGADDSDEVGLGKEPSRSGVKKTGSSKSPPPKASSDSDVRLVLEGGDVGFAVDAGSKSPGSKAPVSPPPKAGSSKSRGAPPVQDDSGVRIVPLDQPSDSDVKIVPSSPPHDSDIPAASKQPTKKKSDSDIRIEELHRGGKADQMVTEEIDLDAEQRKAEAARAKATRQRPKPGSSPMLPTTSPFELSEHDIDVTRAGPATPAPTPAGEQADSDTDSSSDFELKPMTDSSSPLELGSDEMSVMMGDDEVNLGDMTGGKGASGIRLQDPADSGISLEPEASGEELPAPSGRTPKPAPVSEPETDSSSDFELNVDESGSSSTDSSSDFELSLQDEDASSSEGSSEFELSLDADGSDLAVEEGSSDLVMETPGSDSDSEFELTLDDSGGLSVEEGASSSGAENVFETDFEVPSLGEESGSDSSDAVALEESDTDLGSSEFDLSVEGESGSQVVPLEDEEDYDEGAATVQRKAKTRGAAAGEEGLEDLGEALDEDLDEAPAGEEEAEPAVAAAPAPPADWGVMVPMASLFCTIILFVVTLMSFELLQGMWGYHTGNKVSNMLIHPIAKMLSGDDKLPEN
jgi:excisionase family DNA binding protein